MGCTVFLRMSAGGVVKLCVCVWRDDGHLQESNGWRLPEAADIVHMAKM